MVFIRRQRKGGGGFWPTFPNHLEVPPLTEPDHDLIRERYFPSVVVDVVMSAEGTLGRLVIRLRDLAGIEAIRRRRITDGRRDIPLL